MPYDPSSQLTPEEMAILGPNPTGHAVSQILGNRTFRSDMRRPPGAPSPPPGAPSPMDQLEMMAAMGTPMTLPSPSAQRGPMGRPAPAINPSIDYSSRPQAMAPAPDPLAGLGQQSAPAVAQQQPQGIGGNSKKEWIRPQDRAFLLRMAGGLSDNKGLNKAFSDQADTIMNVAESKRDREAQEEAQRRRNEEARKLQEARFGHESNRWKAQDTAAEAKALAEQLDQMTGHAEIQAYINAETPEERAKVASQMTSRYGMEWYYKNAGGPKTDIDINIGDGIQALPDYAINDGAVAWINPDDATKGYLTNDGHIRYLPGSKPKNATDAGRLAQAVSGEQALELALPILFADGDFENGEISDKVLLQAAGNIPRTKGRSFRALYDHGIQYITRVETGAAMPPSELDNTRSRFLPSILDSDELVRAKVRLFRDFMSNAQDYMVLGSIDKGTGKPRYVSFNEVTYQNRLDQAMSGEEIGNEDVGAW